MLAVPNHLYPVDEHVRHARGVLMRTIEGGMVLNRLRIEHHDVGVVTARETSAPLQPKSLCGKRRQPPDRLFERNHPLIAHVPGE